MDRAHPDEPAADKTVAQCRDNAITSAVPGGESLVEVQARAAEACGALAAAHVGATIALVTHGDVIRTALAHYLGLPLDLYHRVMVAPASVSVIELPASGPPRVPAVNRLAGAVI